MSAFGYEDSNGWFGERRQEVVALEAGEQSRGWRIMHVVVEVLARVLFRIRYGGLSNVPRTGPAVLAPNHISVLDPAIVALAPSRLGRTVRFVAGAEFFDRPFIGTALRGLGQIPIRRGAADWNALEELAAAIRGGTLAGIFPEGKVGEGEEVQRGEKGMARVALAAGVPIIPVGLWGTQARWPMAGFRWTRPFRTKVVVVYGRPIQAVGDPHDRRAVRDLTDRVMAEIAVLAAQAQRLAARKA